LWLIQRQHTTCHAMPQSMLYAAFTLGVSAGIDKSYILREHNINRCMHGASALTWDNSIATQAQSWANKVGYNFYHGGTDSPTRVGQNQYGRASSGTADATKNAVAGWMSEENQGTYGGGHYTQVLWKASQKLGCGIWVGKYSGMNAESVVCDYSPPGNYNNDYAKQVGGRVKSRSQCQSEAQALEDAEALTFNISTSVEGCTRPGSIAGGSCKNCLESAQCSSGFCCPYMKKCVSSSSQGCSLPIASCRPTCHTASCTSCKPTDGSSYSSWAPATCSAEAIAV